MFFHGPALRCHERLMARTRRRNAGGAMIGGVRQEIGETGKLRFTFPAADL